MMTTVSPVLRGEPWVLEDLEQAYRLHRTHLIRLAALSVGDPARAEDLVQEVFAALHRRRPRLEDPSKLLAYLRNAVLNRCRSELRHRSRGDRAWSRASARPGPVVAGPDDAVTADDSRRLVLEAVRRLPGRQREVVLLRYYADLSESEIAATLGVSAGTVKTAAHRAMAALAPRLEELR